MHTLTATLARENECDPHLAPAMCVRCAGAAYTVSCVPRRRSEEKSMFGGRIKDACAMYV